MDPTTVPPPSPEKSPQPPPQNPHTATDAMIDSCAFDCYQKGEPSTSRNIDNFRALVMKLTGRLLPAHQSLIERRFDDIFPDELPVPDHPPYADMILTALWELNAEGGSSEEAISDFIEKEYHDLPWAHATMLNHHLRDLCMKGKIAMTHDRCYLRCLPITKPVPSPCHHLLVNDSPFSSPISSPCSSSSSASIFSTPSSSSSSFCWDPPYKSHKRQLKKKRERKRENIKGRGCKMVQVRGRGRGRQPRMIQVGQHGTSIGTIQAKRRGRSSKELEIGEKSQMEVEQLDVINGDDLVDMTKLEEPKQVTEDQNEVTCMEVEEDAIQDGDLHKVISGINQQGQEDGAEKQHNQPQKKNDTVVETGFSLEDQTKVIIEQNVGGEWNENLQEKGESVGLRRSGRMKNDVDGENLPCEQHKVGDKEQYQPQKQYNFTWIGRGEHFQGKGACVKQRRSGSKQHVSKEQHQPCEPLEEGIKEQGHQRKQHNVMWVGRGVRKLKEAARDLLEQQSDDEVTELEDCVSEEEDAVMIGCDAEVDKHVEESKQKEVKGATNIECNQPEENQQSHIVEKHVVDKEQLMSVTDDKNLPCEQMVDMEAELEVAEKLQLKQQLCIEDLPETLQLGDKVTEEELQYCGQDWLKNGEAKSAEEQPQQEEQQTEVNQKENELAMDTEVQQDLPMNQGETAVRRACVIQNESEERQHVTEKHVQPQDHCTEGNKFQLLKQQQRDVMEQVQPEGELQVAEDEHRQEQLNKVKEKDIVLVHRVSNGLQDSEMTQTEVEIEGDSEEHNKSELHQDQLEKRETVISEVQPQQEGQQNKVLQEEPEPMANLTEVKQDLMMIQSGSQLERTSVEHNKVKQEDTVVGQVQPHKLLMKGTKEGQEEENEAGFDKNQSEECVNAVTVQRYHPQEKCVERIEERSQPCIQQTEVSEKDVLQEKSNAVNNENLASSSSTIEVSRALSCNSLGVAKAYLPDHKHRDEQRRPLRQGLRSSCKKEEATSNAKNQLEQVTPVRRSLRPRKTMSEAAVVIEEGPRHSKEQLKHSGHAQPSKRKPRTAEAEQVSKSQRTRRTGL